MDELPQPLSVHIQTDEIRCASASGSGGEFGTDGAQVRLVPTDPGLSVRLHAPGAAVRRVAIRWPLPEHGCDLMFRDHWERNYGDMGWRAVDGGEPLPWYFYAQSPHQLMAWGVQTGAGSLAHWRLEPDAVTLILDVRAGGVGVELGDRELEAAVVVTDRADRPADAFDFATRFCQKMCPKPRLADGPVYGGNDWYYAYGNNSREQILGDATNIASWAEGLTRRPFMVIDDGWQLTRSRGGINGGPWTPNDQFGDMAQTADAIRQLDVRPGIWLRPLLTVEHVPRSWLFPPARFDRRYLSMGEMLDPSVPEALEHIAGDIRRMTQQWGFEMIKHDWSTWDILGRWGSEMMGLTTADGWSFADRSRTTAEIISGLYATIREAAGDALLIGCNTVGHLAAGTHEIQRTGDDTSGKLWERTRRMGINTLAMRMPQQSTFFANDADCVGITDKLPWSLNRQWLDLVARSGTPLFVSADPKALGPDHHRDLKQAFANASEPRQPARPLDWQARFDPCRWRFDGGEETTYDWYTGADPFDPGVRR